MLTKYPGQRKQIEFVTLDALVLQDHLLRKINAIIDFFKIYELWQSLLRKQCTFQRRSDKFSSSFLKSA